MITLYTLFSCTSCRKAKEVLIKHHIPFVERNMEKDPLTREELMSILSLTEGGTEDIISVRSSVAKSLESELENTTLNQWVQRSIDKPRLLRAPLLVMKNQLIVGYVKDHYDGLARKHVNQNGLKQSS